MARKCRNPTCKKQFEPSYNTIQPTCSPKCALEWVRIKEARKFAKETRKKRAKFRDNDKSHWMRKAQSEFNRYIRLRDATLPCVSCGVQNTPQWDAGHYRSRGAMGALRFHPDNCQKQCSRCNDHLSGNPVPYREELIKRIGQEKVDWLDGDHPIANFTLQDFKDVYQLNRSLIKQIEGKI